MYRLVVISSSKVELNLRNFSLIAVFSLSFSLGAFNWIGISARAIICSRPHSYQQISDAHTKTTFLSECRSPIVFETKTKILRMIGEFRKEFRRKHGKYRSVVWPKQLKSFPCRYCSYDSISICLYSLASSSRLSSNTFWSPWI